MSDKKKVSTAVYVDPDQLKELRNLSYRTSVPMAEYIRQGIGLVIEKVKSDPGTVWFR